MTDTRTLSELSIQRLSGRVKTLEKLLEEKEELLRLEREHNQVLARGLAEIAVIVRSKA